MTQSSDAETERARSIVEHMLKHDAFSRWLGIEVKSIAPGQAVLSMAIRAEMLNGFGSCHGGLQYALADSALAFASNGRGRKAVALRNDISYPAPVHGGDVLEARAKEASLGNSTATYDIEIVNQHQRTVALFRGTVYRLREEWSV